MSLSHDSRTDYLHDGANLGDQVLDEKYFYTASYPACWPWRVLDDYASGHAAIHLQIGCRTFAGDPCDFSAIYEVNKRTLENMVGGVRTALPSRPDIEGDGSGQDDLTDKLLSKPNRACSR